MEKGRRIDGRYRLVREIGAGGMGVVWLARDELLEREVALKCARVPDARSARRLRREARNAGRFHHANIVSVLNFVVDGSVCWIVMEYLPSRSLREIIREQGRIGPEAAGSLGCQIADALAVSHRAGVVHGDVTPENILVTPEGVAKLTDFGISRAAWGETTQSAGVRGKPRYMPPEVAREKAPDHKSDVFSLGASLYAAVEGHSPYGQAEHALAYLNRAAEGRVEPPRRAGPLTEPLSAMLRADPRRRPGAAAVRQMLMELTPPPAEVRRRLRRTRGGVLAALRARALPYRARPSARAAGLTALALAGAAALAALGPWGLDGRTAPPGPVAAVRDARRADPCALLGLDALARHGHAEVDDDYGEFDRCDALISAERGGPVVADVVLSFSADRAELGSRARTERIGEVVVSELPGGRDECERNLRLADGHEIWISARREREPAPDLCALAGAATEHAVSVLNRGPVPERPASFVPKSLARLDACALLDAGALGRAGAWRPPDADFARWECAWRSTAGDTAVNVVFSRDNEPAGSGRPKTLGGRRAHVEPGGHGDDTCVVRTEYRDYRDPSGGSAVELVLLEVWGKRPQRELCATAETLTTAVAAELPR
ncbi:hypothetical protein GCM10010232_68340 [Streptomyces amakusaensis]|uniref:non-specific serine/threonine protein kinase n=1 Tax=Streptomyces amakusaensis TaxID=67271 RepID=A0ABW0AV94_9ACTN